jgi:hypothetical protein
MGDLLNSVTKSFSSFPFFVGQESGKSQDEGNPFSFLNIGAASRQNDQVGGQRVVLDDKQMVEQQEMTSQALISLRRQRRQDFEIEYPGDLETLKEALRQLVQRKQKAPEEETKKAKDHKSMAAIKGIEIRKTCAERTAQLPSTTQQPHAPHSKHDPFKEKQARLMDEIKKLKEKEQERASQDLEARMDAEKQKRRVDADSLTKAGNEHEDKGNLHDAIAAYDKALRIQLYGKQATEEPIHVARSERVLQLISYVL